jgi:hypothetical protein
MYPMSKKTTVAYLVCIAMGVGVGWYVGNTRPNANLQRVLAELESETAEFSKQRTEYFKAAAPYAASGASIALATLKNLEANDLERAKSRLAAMIATYYRGHLPEGDTNLLASIADFAATNSRLSNAVFGAFQGVGR